MYSSDRLYIKRRRVGFSHKAVSLKTGIDKRQSKIIAKISLFKVC